MCDDKSNDKSNDEKLFDRLGGSDAIASMIEEMYTKVLADDELADFFKGVDMTRLPRMQFEFIASALGGPVSYSGAELQGIHAGRGITPHHFAKFVGHFASVMESRDVPKADIDQMLGQMATYRDKIVGGANVDG